MIETLHISFKTPISVAEVQYLRGAVIALGKENGGLLLHNHQSGDTLRYSYPLVQYKRIRGKAFILCFEEGVEIMMDVMCRMAKEVKLGERSVSFNDYCIRRFEENVIFVERPICYTLQNWIPFNGENFHKYLHTPSLLDKIEILQDILTGNILSFAKGLGIYCDNHIEVTITDVDKPTTQKSKEIDFLCFNVDFLCNLQLPQYMGLGKNVSKGYGIVSKKYRKYK